MDYSKRKPKIEKNLHLTLFNIEEENPNSNRSSLFEPQEESKITVNVNFEEDINNTAFEKERKAALFHFKNKKEDELINAANSKYNSNSEEDEDKKFEFEFDENEEVDRITLYETVDEFELAKNNISFFEGRPKNEEEILKLECPLYRSRTSFLSRNLGSSTIKDKKLKQLKDIRKNSNFSNS